MARERDRGRSQATSNQDFKVFLKPIASGEVVLANRDNEIFRRIRLHYNDAAAIEMESAGMFQAAQVNSRMAACVIRGISDHANALKSEMDRSGSQALAAANAAEFMSALLRVHSWAGHRAESSNLALHPPDEPIAELHPPEGLGEDVASLRNAAEAVLLGVAALPSSPTPTRAGNVRHLLEDLHARIESLGYKMTERVDVVGVGAVEEAKRSMARLSKALNGQRVSDSTLAEAEAVHRTVRLVAEAISSVPRV